MNCFMCNGDTSFIAHAPDVCLTCGDKMQDPVYAIEVARRYHKACVQLKEALDESSGN